MDTQVIEFNAAEKTRGNWFFHCHILYHMMSGMGRIFTYEDSPPNPQLPHPHAGTSACLRNGPKMVPEREQ